MFYITFFIFYYTLFNIYQRNLTVTNYQKSYPSYQKSYPNVTTVIIPTLLSDYHFLCKIRTYINFPKAKISTYITFPNLKITTYGKKRQKSRPIFCGERPHQISPQVPPRSEAGKTIVKMQLKYVQFLNHTFNLGNFISRYKYHFHRELSTI